MIPLKMKCINSNIDQDEMADIESLYAQAFDRLGHFIRDAEITLRDINGPKGGLDKLCTLQFRFYPRGLAIVKGSGRSFAQAANSACEKMQQVAARRLSKKKSISISKLPVEMKGA